MYQEQRFFDYPQVSICPTSVTVYNRILDSFTGDFLKRKRVNELPESNSTQGFISKKAYSRIYKRVFAYIYNVDKQILIDGNHREKIGFVTLTLPSSQVKEVSRRGKVTEKVLYHTDQEIKSKCLNQLFVELSKHYGLREKVWKAEKQLNGNIHFHILVDKYIPYEDLRLRWNRIINKLGYVDRYAEKYQNVSESSYISLRLCADQESMCVKEKSKLVEKYKKIYRKSVSENWQNPNSVDIHSLYKDEKGRKISNVVAYIAKYVSKTEGDVGSFGFDNVVVSGRLWYCSRFTSACCRVVVDLSEEIIKEIEKVKDRIKDLYMFTDEYFTAYCFSIVQASKRGVKLFDDIFESNMLNLRMEYG